MKKKFMLFAIVSSFSALTMAAEIAVPMHLVNDKGLDALAGQVTISESSHGLVFTPALKGLTPGMHGFHVHQNPSCLPKELDGKMVPALSAGGHYDPENTKRHGTPWGDGHLGDLPALFVDAGGNATQPLLAPRLKMADVKERALMIHVGGENHSDHPAPLGGGGARMVCGVIR